MAYSSNILPAFRSWTKSSSSITVNNTVAHFTTSNTYLSYTYSFGKLAQIGNKARITMSSCTGKAYVILYMFDNQAEPSFAYCAEYKNNTVIDIELPSISVIRLYFRVVAREADIDIDGISFNFEQVAEINASTPGSSIETLKPTYSTFRSTPLVHGNSVSDILVSGESTLATLDVALSPTLAQYKEAREVLGQYSTTKQSNHIEVSSTIAFSKKTLNNTDYIARLYFGDRVLVEKYINSESILLYQNTEVSLHTLLYIEDTYPVDMRQNISLKLTLAINNFEENASSQIVRIDFGHTYISATGPLRSLEFYAKDAFYAVTADYTLDYNNLSFTPYYEKPSTIPSEIHYTLPIRDEDTFGGVCKIEPDAYTEALQITQVTYEVYSLSYEAAKVRKVFVTETKNIWNPEICTAQSGVEVLIVLTTSGILYCCDNSGAVLFTIASNVKDFDVTLCGLQGQILDYNRSVGDVLAPYGALFMDRIIGFTVFYITESALYICAYPKVGTTLNISSLTLPSASTVDTIQVQMPNMLAAGFYFDRIRVSALYFVCACSMDGVNKNNLAFGLSLSTYKPESGGTPDAYGVYSGYIWVSFNANSLGSHPAYLSNNEVSAWASGGFSLSADALLQVATGTNAGTEGSRCLNNIVSTAATATESHEMFYHLSAHGNIYETYPGVGSYCGRQYFEYYLSSRDGFTTRNYRSIAPSIITNVSEQSSEYSIVPLLDMLPTGWPASIFVGKSLFAQDESVDLNYTVKISLGVMPFVQVYDHSVINEAHTSVARPYYNITTSRASFFIGTEYTGAVASRDATTGMIKYTQSGATYHLSTGSNIKSGAIQVHMCSPNLGQTTSVLGWRNQYRYHIIDSDSLFYDFINKGANEYHTFEITTDGTFGQIPGGSREPLYLARNDLKYTGWVPILYTTIS